MAAPVSKRVYNALIGFEYLFREATRDYQGFIDDLIDSVEAEQNITVSGISDAYKSNLFVYRACQLGVEEMIPIAMQLASKRRTEEGVEVEYEDRIKQLERLHNLYTKSYEKALAENDPGSTLALISGWSDEWDEDTV